MPAPRAVLFDFNGTLSHDEHVLYAIYAEVFAEHGRPLTEAEYLGGLAGNTGMSVAEVADCPLFLTGPASEIQDRLAKRREETGLSYIVIQGRDMEQIERFAEEVMRPLARA